MKMEVFVDWGRLYQCTERDRYYLAFDFKDSNRKWWSFTHINNHGKAEYFKADGPRSTWTASDQSTVL